MNSSLRPPLLASWMLRRLTRGAHSEAFQGDLLEAWRAGRGNAWYWRQVLAAVAATACQSGIAITRSTKLWIALAALGITTSGLLTIPVWVSLGMHAFMRVSLANHGKWWWPLVVNGLTWLPLTVAFVITFARRRRQRLPPA